MYLTTHRIAHIRGPDDPSYAVADTSVHGFLYTHGPDFEVDSADVERITTRNPGGNLAVKLTPGVSPGGNAVLSYLDVVASDGITRAALEAKFKRLTSVIGETATLPVVQSDPDIYLKYHISPRSYREEQRDWNVDFQGLEERALELFDRWQQEAEGAEESTAL